MDRNRISAAIMCHPRRRAAAERLAAAVAGLNPVIAADPEPDGPPTTLRAALHAWRAIHPEATHHLVLQDDVLVVDGFAEVVAASAARHPDAPLAFAAFWNSWNGSAVRIAAVAGRSWARAVAEEFTPTLALLLPRDDVAGLLRAAPASGATTPDDVAVRDYLRRSGRPPLLAVPNLVEHGEGPSIVGNDHHGPRRVTCFAGAIAAGAAGGAGGAEDAGSPGARRAPGVVGLTRPRSSDVQPAQTILPHLAGERANVLLWDSTPGRERWRWLPWAAFLRHAGLSGTVTQSANWMQSALPDSGLAELSPRQAAFAREVWGASLLLGLLAGPPLGGGCSAGGHPAIVGECLRTLVLGGVTHSRLRGWATERLPHLTDLAQVALRRGAALARRGPLPSLDRDLLTSLPDGRQVWDFMGGPQARAAARRWGLPPPQPS